MEINLDPIEHLLITSSVVAATLRQIEAAERQGKKHPAAVYARDPGGRVYLPGGRTNDKLVGILLTLPAAQAIDHAIGVCATTETATNLDAKLAEFRAAGEAEQVKP